jgi:hypothetical protein
MASTAAGSGRVTRDDLEAKIREIQGSAGEQAASAKGTLVAVGGVAAATLFLIVFVLGRRAGKQRTTIVEIKRV